MKNINVSKSQIEITADDKVKVSSAELATALIQNNKDVLEQLKLSPNEITISADGKLIISKKEFLEAIKPQLTDFSISADSNGICGVRC